jgi:hypothetical protein
MPRKALLPVWTGLAKAYLLERLSGHTNLLFEQSPQNNTVT